MIHVLSLVLNAIVVAGSSTEDAIAMKLYDFPLPSVRLLDGRLLDEQERNRAYLHELDSDRLLYSFRKNAGLPAPGEPYGGWEAPTSEVRGHFVGHYLSACALMYASTGDEELKAKAGGIIAELSKCQQALGGEYLSAFPESFFDRVETGQPVWVPYYTIHKIMAGLFDMHTLCENAQALPIMEAMASYHKRRVDKLAPDALDRMLRTEFGGMSEVLHNLYGLTRKPEHLALAHRFDQGEFLGPLALEWDNLTRIHGNTQIPKIVGAARRYELTGDTRYRDIATFFWDRVVNYRTYATGGSTMFEAWPEPGKLANTLGHLNHETCKTYNMLRLTRHLLEWTGDVRYADFYERAFLNGILGTQGEKPGQFQYYAAMATGYPRVYGTPDNSFWCCYGSGVESFSKLGDSLYFHNGRDLYLNLYANSELTWRERGIRIEQRARLLEDGHTALTLHLEGAKRFAINVRVPYWIAGEPEIRINGRKEGLPKAEPSSWLSIKRRWKDGDRLEVHLPMKLHTMALPDDPQTAAFMYGPAVLAGVVDDCTPKEDVSVHAMNDGISLFQKSRITGAGFFVGDPAKPENELKLYSKDPLRFGTIPLFTRFVPFCDVLKERYGLYWPFSSSRDSERYKAWLERTKRMVCEVDRVFVFPREIDETCSERKHNLQGEKTTAGTVPSTAFVYRHAEPGGWFSWDLAVLPDKPMELLCTFWGSDDGRVFDVLVDGNLIATPSLKPDHPGELVDVVYPIPAEMTKGKDSLTVAFRGTHNTMAGGVFGCATLKGK